MHGTLAVVMNPSFTNAMKHRIWLLAPLAFALGAICNAQDIDQCVTGNGVAYRKGPCPPGRIDTGGPRLPGYADPAQRDGATSPPADAAFAAQDDAAMQVSPLLSMQEAFAFRTPAALASGGRDAVPGVLQ